jgi:hypothetical protein
MHYIATVAVVELHMDNFRGLTNERHRPAVLRHMLIENALSDAVRGSSMHGSLLHGGMQCTCA